MANNILGLVHRLMDDSGAIEPSATVEVYSAGTTTPLTIYSDRALTTTAGYVMTADAAGVIPERWIPSGTLIKLVYKDADGATKYTRDYANDNSSAADEGVVDPDDYGAVGDAIKGTDGVATATDNTFTSASASFTSADIGKVICIHGAGTASAVHVTTIASINSATSIELTAAAITTVASSATYAYGTDDKDELAAAAAAAIAADLPLDLRGRTYAVSGNLDWSYDDLRVNGNGATIIQLNPGATTKTVYATGASNIQIRDLKIDRFGGGRSGAITTQAGIWLDQCPRAKVIDCEVYGNDEGNGIVVWLSPQASIVRPYIHDLYYYHVAQADDVIQGIWAVYSDDFLIDQPRIRKFGRTDQTSASRDRYNRGIAASGCRGGVINNPQLYRLDQAIDITGDSHNSNILVNGGSIRHCYSTGVKFAVSAVGCKAIGVEVEAAGLYGFFASGTTAGALNLTQDCDFVGCTARNIGGSKQQTAANIKGFSAERGSGAASPYTAWPKNIQFKECLAVSDVGAAAVTVASTTLLTVSSAAPIKAALGVRVRFTTSGSLPTGLALATDYWPVPIRATSTVAIATSYINALDAYEAQEAGLSYSAYVVSTLAGGSGTHTMTLFQDMYDGFFNNVAIGDADTTALNRAVNCQSFGQTNKRFNGIQTGVPIWASFSARSAGDINNVTGDGTTYDVIWDTEVSDPSGGFNTTTGIWTAPETGQYLLTTNLTLSGMAAGNDRVFLSITTSNRNYQQDYGDIPADANTRVGCAISALVDMEEGDTAYVQIFVSGATKVVDIKGGALSTFTGALIGG